MIMSHARSTHTHTHTHTGSQAGKGAFFHFRLNYKDLIGFFSSASKTKRLILCPSHQPFLSFLLFLSIHSLIFVSSPRFCCTLIYPLLVIPSSGSARSHDKHEPDYTSGNYTRTHQTACDSHQRKCASNRLLLFLGVFIGVVCSGLFLIWA